MGDAKGKAGQKEKRKRYIPYNAPGNQSPTDFRGRRRSPEIPGHAGKLQRFMPNFSGSTETQEMLAYTSYIIKVCQSDK